MFHWPVALKLARDRDIGHEGGGDRGSPTGTTCRMSACFTDAGNIPNLQEYCISHTGVCEKSTPPEKTTPGKISLNNSKSGTGEEFLLLDFSTKARRKGLLFTDTGTTRAVIHDRLPHQQESLVVCYAYWFVMLIVSLLLFGVSYLES